jgi:predicted alpha-1,2-mannosidase
MGFTHTHYSGTGGGGGSDILFMPDTGRIKWRVGPEKDPAAGYRSAFSHDNEMAEPGYYKVLLDDNRITVELTATQRCAFHRYTFPAESQAYVLLDMIHGNEDHPDSLFLHYDTEKNELTGYRAASGGLDGPKIWFFVARFREVPEKMLISGEERSSAKGKNIKAAFSFSNPDNKPVLLKIGLSTISIEGARKNLDREIAGWDFGAVRRRARDAWEKELEKITIEGATEKQKRIFYTAMYHTFIHPSINMDVDGQYRSTNGQVYTAEGFTNYTTFSLWDTWRALHPLQTIINRQRTLDFIRTFLERYEHSGNMPIMEFSGNERYAMIGYHSLPVVADAWAKGIRGYDKDTALQAMIHLADSYRPGKQEYLSYGFIPFDLAAQSVSRTLEYAYDDWCVTRLAEGADPEAFNLFSQRGQFYRNLFKKDVSFMVPKSSEYTWLEDFNPGESSSNYTEANAWQYTPSVFQDVYGLIDLMGGDTAFTGWLDRLFTTPVDTTLMTVIDASGQIGQYAHGNEPSHHIAYLYDFTGAPWKTQHRIRQILTELYDDTPAGISGNDDAGQMSAWYVLSSMGLYAVTPGMNYFVIGSPLFDKATVRLENGKTFVIRARHNAPDHSYIQKVTLNGKRYTKTWIPYDVILSGGELVFTMGKDPNMSWGNAPVDRPPLPHYESAPLPVISFAQRVFLRKTQVTLSCPAEGAVIRYTLDGSLPDENAPEYREPITIDHSLTLRARCYVPGLPPGYAVAQTFRKADLTAAVSVRHPRPGLRYRYHEGTIETTREINKYPVQNRGIIATFNVDSIKDRRPFSQEFTGYLYAPVTGLYKFYLESNDGAVLYIDGEKIIDNDGGHPAQALLASKGLQKGYHPIRVDYFQLGRAKKLVVKWKLPGSDKLTVVPAERLFH